MAEIIKHGEDYICRFSKLELGWIRLMIGKTAYKVGAPSEQLYDVIAEKVPVATEAQLNGSY